MATCVVGGCGSDESLTTFLHAFPKSPEIRAKWEHFVIRTTKGTRRVSSSSRICSAHFTYDSFLKCNVTQNSSGFGGVLKPHAVPTIFHEDIQSANHMGDASTQIYKLCRDMATQIAAGPIPVHQRIKAVQTRAPTQRLVPSAENISDRELYVDHDCLMELFQPCRKCKSECDVSVQGERGPLSVAQECQSCSFHRLWMSHPVVAKEPLQDEEVAERTDHSYCLHSNQMNELSDEESIASPSSAEEQISDEWEPEKELFKDSDDSEEEPEEVLNHEAKRHKQLCQDCGVFSINNGKTHVCDYKNKPYACLTCGKRCLTKGGYKVHCRTHHDGYANPCKYCLTPFKTRPDKLEHEQSHFNEEQPYSCSDCPERFSDLLVRNGHLKSHAKGPWKHVCNICHKGFNKLTPYERHLLIHTGEKPYTCEVCQRSFNQDGHLRSHMRQHTGERPFMCEHCGKCFTHNVSLKNHLQRHHGQDSAHEEGEEEHEATDSSSEELEQSEKQSDDLVLRRRGRGRGTRRGRGRGIGRPPSSKVQKEQERQSLNPSPDTEVEQRATKGRGKGNDRGRRGKRKRK